MALEVEKIQQVKMLVMDVDGIMTDARILMTENGDWKRFFSVRDGIGIVRLREHGYKTAVITGANSLDVRKRMEHLKIDYFFENKRDKIPAFLELQDQSGLSAGEMSYIGDDVPDIPLIQQARFGVSVPEAVDDVLKECDYITRRHGGFGAVRELCELILEHGAFRDNKPSQRYGETR